MSLYWWGWKDILRPIRDRLRDGWNPSKRSPSPTPEERDLQRRRDALRGFAYLDTFDQLRGWSTESADRLHVANTPLMKRAPDKQDTEQRDAGNGDTEKRYTDKGGVDDIGTDKSSSPKSRVLLCHDYSGNYHDYESLQATGVDEEKYSCEYLQYVDTFVYFSHKLVTIPPAPWTNTLHRNGVKVLGTFIVEPQTPGFEFLLERVDTELPSGETLYFRMARQLAHIAEKYGFDGWLVNLEKPLPKEYWDLVALLDFLEQLKTDLGEGRELVWYDALTVNNEVEYQNSVTNQNVAFARAAGSILTNYRWDEKGALSSLLRSQENEINPSNIFFGIDVWAQNKHKTGPARITYPKEGGGGTNTGVGVEKLAELGLSVGIFAPAWSHEHFPSDGRAVERAIWDGVELPDDLSCDCKDALTHRTQRYRTHPVAHFAQGHPAGSKTYFSTNFERAFSSHSRSEDAFYNDKKLHSQLGAQSILPHIRRVEPSANSTLSAVLLDCPSRLSISFNPSQNSSLPKNTWLPLFNLFITDEVVLSATYHLTPGYKISFYLADDLDEHHTLEPVRASSSSSNHSVFSTRVNGDDQRNNRDRKIRQLGIYLYNDGTIPVAPAIHVLDIFSITLVPPTNPNIKHFAITDIRTILHDPAQPSNPPQRRLTWQYTEPQLDERESWEGVPRSNTSGPFAYFEVAFEGVPVLRAYALECIVPQLQGVAEVEVRVTGVGFDGQRGRTGCARVTV